MAHFGNILNFTAMSPGNHEFDDHVAGFVPFLRNKTFPVVAANIDVSLEPELADLGGGDSVDFFCNRNIYRAL